MNNSKIIIIGVIIIVFVAGVFYFKNNSQKTVTETPAVTENNTQTENQVENPSKKEPTICDTFPKEEIAIITGLNITSSAVFSLKNAMENTSCGYYVDGKEVAHALSIGLFKGDLSKQLERYNDPIVFRDWRVLKDDVIPMDNFITYNEVSQLNDIYLIKGPSEFYRISLYSLSAVSSGKMKSLAIKVVEKIK
jgi:hypothetical protein